MRNSDSQFVVPLGYEPALSAAPPSDFRFDRHAVFVRWFVAVALMGAIASVLMVGAIYAAFGRMARSPMAAVAAAPLPSQPAAPTGGRAARFNPAAAPDPSDARIQVEQLNSSGSRITHFTHLVADLAHIPGSPTPNSPPTTTEGDEPGGRGRDDRPQQPASPFDLMIAASQLAAPTGASAYAPIEGQRSTRPAPLGAPINVTVIAKAAPADADVEKERVIIAKPGDGLALILQTLGAAPADASAITSGLLGGAGDGSQTLAGGERIVILQDASQEAHGAGRPLKVSLESPEAPTAAVALSDDGRYLRVATQEDGKSDLARASDPLNKSSNATVISAGSIRVNLYNLAERGHVDRSLVDEFMRVCEHDLDLELPVSADDSAEFLYDSDDGEGSQLAFAKLTVGGKARQYYRFEAPDDGSVDYYDESGHSVTRFLLRKPVAAGRLGDGFGWRIHPVLGDRRFHEGTDYAAPFGSPIVAAGAGVVETIGWQWGYGKYIRIRHDWGYETTYAHVAGFPNAMKVGTRVRQGQTIAFVGSTGLSTGSHLYYEVRINGHNVDPLRIKLAAGRVLQGDALSAFERQRQSIEGLIKAASVVASSAH
ncbi:M23 family metallopeptidase [Methylocapsa sp. S129]|uniref:M23 family metallopeptidase n=1 Tax=Methylocapsa sp. S129 TaxID=1641869 RepID=UPI00131E5713|nr:M23 family metallopeptidase [Methylocapsa sp. S129]